MSLPFMSDGRPMLWLMRSDGAVCPAETLRGWSEAMYGDGAAHRRIAQDDVGDYFVSTIFTGIDTELRGPPMVFETMVFKRDAPARPRRQIRNPSAAEALETHAALVAEYAALGYSSSSS